MKKKILLIIGYVVISLILILPSIEASILNDFTSFTGMNNIELGMEFTDFKVMYPDVNGFGNDSKAICMLEFSETEDTWNNGTFLFKDGKLKHISLARLKLKNVVDTEQYFNIDQKVIPIIDKLTKKIGEFITIKVNKKEDDLTHYEPVIIWKHKNITVSLSYTPQKQIKKVLIPHISLAIMSEDESHSSYFHELHELPCDQVSLDDLLSEGIKKSLYGSSEVIIK